MTYTYCICTVRLPDSYWTKPSSLQGRFCCVFRREKKIIVSYYAIHSIYGTVRSMVNLVHAN